MSACIYWHTLMIHQREDSDAEDRHGAGAGRDRRAVMIVSGGPAVTQDGAQDSATRAAGIDTPPQKNPGPLRRALRRARPRAAGFENEVAWLRDLVEHHERVLSEISHDLARAGARS